MTPLWMWVVGTETEVTIWILLSPGQNRGRLYNPRCRVWALFCADQSYRDLGLRYLRTQRMALVGLRKDISNWRSRQWFVINPRDQSHDKGPSPAQARYNQPDSVTPTGITKKINNPQGILSLVQSTIMEMQKKTHHGLYVIHQLYTFYLYWASCTT